MSATVSFDGQVVVVTGSGRGMGRSHALALGSRGAAVVVNDVDHGETRSAAARAVADEIRAAGGTAVDITADVATAEGCAQLIDTTVTEFGRLDAVIHNAGVATVVPVAELTGSDLAQVFDVNLFGAVHLTKAAWPHFRKAGAGRLLYITSAAGLYGAPGFGHYGPSKAGLLSLARVVALEGREFGIRCNALAVAAMTRMMEQMLGGEQMFAKRSSEIGWWRTNMRPEYTTPAALWLIHPDCGVSGGTFEARCGRVARVFVAETRGYINPGHSVEDVRDHFAEVEDMSEWLAPQQSADLVGWERRWLSELSQPVSEKQPHAE